MLLTNEERLRLLDGSIQGKRTEIAGVLFSPQWQYHKKSIARKLLALVGELSELIATAEECGRPKG